VPYLEVAIVKLKPLRCPRLSPRCPRSIFLACPRKKAIAEESDASLSTHCSKSSMMLLQGIIHNKQQSSYKDNNGGKTDKAYGEKSLR
jgi:hypothetical protein